MLGENCGFNFNVVQVVASLTSLTLLATAILLHEQSSACSSLAVQRSVELSPPFALAEYGEQQCTLHCRHKYVSDLPLPQSHLLLAHFRLLQLLLSACVHFS